MFGNTLFLIGSIIVIIVAVFSMVFYAAQIVFALRLKKKIRHEYGSKPVR